MKMKMEEKSRLSAQWWWFDSQTTNTIPRKSPWLHSTLAELDEKTEAMLKLIEEDADSFAKRAEMYYKKRPELITIVEDLYRAHRSLAEKYDQVKFESGGNRHLTPWASCPSPLSKFTTSLSLKESYDTYSESFDFVDHDYYDSDDSVVIDDFEQQQQVKEEEDKGSRFDEEMKALDEEEMMNLRKEIERLREENKIQKEQLIQKDEEKKEAIRQLSFSVDFLKQQNLYLKSATSANDSYKKQTCSSSSSSFEFTKLKGVIWGMFSNGAAVPL